MLLFIHLGKTLTYPLHPVSIHLILLFIAVMGLTLFAEYMFQYISCYSLSTVKEKSYAEMTMFQYISCYSLSFPAPWEPLVLFRFNTSHVTLYLIIPAVNKVIHRFQYISCYSLSFIFDSLPTLFEVSIHLMLLFIVLSRILASVNVSFNTSHVTLYRNDHCIVPSQVCSFNTSHVTLYRNRLVWFLHDTEVSIHLMLLFI